MPTKPVPDSVVVFLGKPQEKQEEFVTATEKYIAYGGARGGGKSWAVRFKLVVLCLKRPGIKCLLIRRTYAELKENHIRTLRMIIPKEVAVYKDTDKVFEFANGSILKLGYCDNENDVNQYQGQEYDIIVLDEATQLTEYQFTTLKACLRGANNFPKHMYITCNPGGVGHAWVKRLFIDREYRDGEKPEEYRFIPAKVHDNQALLKSNPDYIDQLKSLPPGLREAWLDGNWETFDGQYFREFDANIHVCEPFAIPDEWKRYRAFDYGLDMLACLWIAVDFNGNAYVYREFNKSDLLVSEAAKAILENTAEHEKITETYCPPDMWSKQKDTGKSMAEIFLSCGLDIIRASNERVHGWSQVKEYLKPVEVKSPFDGSISQKPKLQIMANCTQLIRNIPLLQHNERNVDDVATQPHDITHNTDALRYFCVSRSSAAAASKKEDNKFEAYKKQVFSGNKKRGYRW